MKKKKRNTLIIIITILILVLLSGSIYFFLNYSADDSSLTVVEKKWITDNANKIIDVNVYNDVPVYGLNGEGINFDFLTYLTEELQIKFNKISYYTDSQMQEGNISFQVLDSNVELSKEDILLYQDHYVILSSGSSSSISLNNTFKLGVLKKDQELANGYFDGAISCLVYEDVDKLMEALKAKEVDYILLPNVIYMDDILKNDLNIVYHVEDLKRDFVLRVKDETIYSILKKSYTKYLKSSYREDYSKNYLSVYFKSTDTTDLLQKNYNAKSYHYGYVVNMPYENSVGNQFVGTILNYLQSFEEVTGVEIETTLYPTIDDLKSALISGEIDFALGNFNYDNLNLDYVVTGPISNLDYVVLSKDSYQVNSLKGLKDKKVSVVASSVLAQELVDCKVDPKLYANTDELLRGMDDYSIVLMDKSTYIYYKDTKLKDYSIILDGTIKDGYKFILNSQNEPFNSLFSYYVSTLDYQTIKYDYHTNVTIDKDYTSIKIFSFIVLLISILIITIILMNRKNVTNPIISKEDKLKYIDPMTSLKNRNYLNANIYKWDDNVIFPQSIIVLDINRLRETNDTFGREIGDEIINKVASVLINNQLENTDIIRSGGDEFLIYMVGYDEKKVSLYTKKLLKEMKDIPNSLGIEVGYSMILDEVKTVDDAINEAIAMMIKNKEKKKAKEKE